APQGNHGKGHGHFEGRPEKSLERYDRRTIRIQIPPAQPAMIRLRAHGIKTSSKARLPFEGAGPCFSCTYCRGIQPVVDKLSMDADHEYQVEDDSRRVAAESEAESHVGQGWMLFYEGKPSEALEKFQEALWAQPDYSSAQHGIQEALQAEHRSYRVLR